MNDKNSGFTLIEVVVSILILTVLIFPLLNGFVISTNINLKANQSQASTDLAQSITEQIKDEGITAWMKSKNGDLDTQQYSGEEKTENFTFLVGVSYEPVQHLTNSAITWNDYQRPDLEAVKRPTTAMMDPFDIFVTYKEVGGEIKGELSDSYDKMAASEFYDQHKVEIYQKWDDACQEAEKNEQPIPNRPDPMSIEQIEKLIDRNIILSIRKEGEKTLVSASIIYTLHCNADYHWGLHISYKPANAGICQEGGAHMKEYSGFYEDIPFQELKDIYLLHTPLPPEWLGGSNSDTISVQDSTGSKANLFIVPQLYQPSLTTTKVDLKGAALTVFRLDSHDAAVQNYLLNGQSIPTYAITNSTGNKKNGIISSLEAENRLYDVHITIKSVDGMKDLAKVHLETK